jgi:hypothetical protein
MQSLRPHSRCIWRQNAANKAVNGVLEGYIGLVEELPGANTQGNTLDEVRSVCFLKTASTMRTKHPARSFLSITATLNA